MKNQSRFHTRRDSTCSMFDILSISLGFWEDLSEIGCWLVLIGVIGESTELLEKFGVLPKSLQRFALKIEATFWTILCVGLTLEIAGSHMANNVSSRQNALLTQQAAQSYKEAEEAKLKSAQLELTVEELRQKNNELESQAEPRTLKWPEAIKTLQQFAGMRAIIFCNEGDSESREIAGAIALVLTTDHWSVTAEYFPLQAPGVGIGVSPGLAVPQELLNAQKALQSELIASEVWVPDYTSVPLNLSYKGIVIEVGRKPSLEEAKLLKVEDEMISPDHPLTSQEGIDLNSQFSQLLTAERMKHGMTVENYIPPSAFPAQ